MGEGSKADVDRLRPPAETALVVVDIQERLFPAMDARQQPLVTKAAGVLVDLAKEAGWTIVVTEQYPKGLGPTIPALREELAAAGADEALEKTAFSACGAGGFGDRLGASRAAVVIGMEAHVCVQETALDLLGRGLTVFVPWDGVASRRDEDRTTALATLRGAGAVVTSSETLVFQHLKEAGGEAFKRLSKRLR